jgi:hypothetical protein
MRVQTAVLHLGAVLLALPLAVNTQTLVGWSVIETELQAIEALYQSANSHLRSPEARDRLQELVLKYPRANRTDCAVLYLAQASSGDERQRLLKKAIENHNGAFYGDGPRSARSPERCWRSTNANTDRREQALALAAAVEKQFPGAVDHSGARLTDTLRRLKLRQ